MNLGIENETLEFKKSTSELKEAMNDVCAILNKHGHGKLLFGVKPNGDVCGQDISASSLDDVAAKIKSAIKPTIYPIINKETIDGKDVIVVDFKGSERPYSSYGRYFLRVHDRAEEMTFEQLLNFASTTDYSSKWENNVTRYTIEDVDKEALRNFYVRAVNCGRLEPLINYDESELLSGLGLMVDGKLTNAGFYLFSNKKPVVLKLATYVTDERINFSDIRREHNNIYNLIRIANKYVIDGMRWRVEYDDKSTSRIEVPEVPVKSLREIIVNSFAHADYRGQTENEIDITPTKIEIYNPGEFPINFTPQDFVNEKRKSVPRNKMILEALYKCKDVEMFGSGFKKVFEECDKNNIDYSYENMYCGFSFTFARTQTTQNVANNVANTVVLSKTDLKVYNLLKTNKFISSEDISNELMLSRRTIQRSLEKLICIKKIIRIGTKKNGYWEVID